MQKTKRKKTNKFTSFIIISIALILLVGIPVGLIEYQSYKTGKTYSQIIDKLFSDGEVTIESEGNLTGEKINFLTPVQIGDEYDAPPLISHIQAVDLDKDGLLDVVVCDCVDNEVSWIRQYPEGVFNEYPCADKLIAPSHVQAIDFDYDGDLDLMVSVLGMLFPNNDKIGSLVILENDGKMNFKKHIVEEKIARASDLRAGDLDGDGDMDLAAVQFGYDDGESRWVENLGGWRFKSHLLQTLSGGINCELIDIDNDNDLDIITLISQEWEEIYLFINDGKANFQPRLLYGATNDDFGSSGIFLNDVDQDGDMDILYTNGDAFDYIPPRPRPWHGINWLENKGSYKFQFHRVANFAGAYNARPVDIDHDGDLDLFSVSSFNLWDKSSSQSFIWLENDGKMNFTRRDITNTPTHLLTLEMGDFNNDGEIDFVTGGMHAYPPYDRMARIMLWTNNWKNHLE
ncbi:FG-GAP repeat domain-containing protein [Bacteroidota bacterium]